MKNCTENGWSKVFPPYELACGHGLNDSFQIPIDLVLSKIIVLFLYSYSFRKKLTNMKCHLWTDYKLKKGKTVNECTRDNSTTISNSTTNKNVNAT